GVAPRGEQPQAEDDRPDGPDKGEVPAAGRDLAGQQRDAEAGEEQAGHKGNRVERVPLHGDLLVRWWVGFTGAVVVWQGSAGRRGDGRGDWGGGRTPDDPDLADRGLGVEHQAWRCGLRPRDEALEGHVDAV